MLSTALVETTTCPTTRSPINAAGPLPGTPSTSAAAPAISAFPMFRSKGRSISTLCFEATCRKMTVGTWEPRARTVSCRSHLEPVPKTRRRSTGGTSLYSFVYADGWTVGSSIWTVRNLEGAVVQYIACSTGTQACFAQLASNSRNTTSKLYWTGSNFIYFHQSGTRFIYSSPWIPPSDPSRPRFFLTQIEDKQYAASGGAPRILASVQYGVPLDGNCPGLEASSSGVPYIQSVSTEDGAQ